MESLHRHTEAERDIRILESKSDGSRLYLDGAVLYTHVDSEGRNRLDYVAAMERALVGARDRGRDDLSVNEASRRGKAGGHVEPLD